MNLEQSHTYLFKFSKERSEAILLAWSQSPEWN